MFCVHASIFVHMSQDLEAIPQNLRLMSLRDNDHSFELNQFLHGSQNFVLLFSAFFPHFLSLLYIFYLFFTHFWPPSPPTPQKRPPTAWPLFPLHPPKSIPKIGPKTVIFDNFGVFAKNQLIITI